MVSCVGDVSRLGSNLDAAVPGFGWWHGPTERQSPKYRIAGVRCQGGSDLGVLSDGIPKLIFA